jgi:tRNA 2-thiouridine synthesizing protein A
MTETKEYCGGDRFARCESSLQRIFTAISCINAFMNIHADIDVDTSGLRCPEPLMVVRNKIRDMATGEVIKVVATDPSTSWDFPKFCKFLNHEMVHQETTESR